MRMCCRLLPVTVLPWDGSEPRPLMQHGSQAMACISWTARPSCRGCPPRCSTVARRAASWPSCRVMPVQPQPHKCPSRRPSWASRPPTARRRLRPRWRPCCRPSRRRPSTSRLLPPVASMPPTTTVSAIPWMTCLRLQNCRMELQECALGPHTLCRHEMQLVPLSARHSLRGTTCHACTGSETQQATQTSHPAGIPS